MRRKARNLLIITGFILLLIICIAIFVWMNPGLGYRAKGSNNAGNSGNILLPEEAVTQAQAPSRTETDDEEENLIDEGEGIEEFVIFGVDTRANNLSKGTRSDSIIIVHIDYDEKTAKCYPFTAIVWYILIATGLRRSLTLTHTVGRNLRSRQSMKILT